MPSFSTALLAGGKSTRMGRDKALLPMPGTSVLLWQRQWRVLEELQPGEMFWSGPARPGAPEHARIVPDVVENAGPLGGISACLDLLRDELLVVLAIDLPRMNAAYLGRLLAGCSAERGTVVRHSNFFEPLAAVYPKSLKALAAEQLAKGRYTLQDFVREAVQRGSLQVVPLAEADLPFFKNVNSPEDLSAT